MRDREVKLCGEVLGRIVYAGSNSISSSPHSDSGGALDGEDGNNPSEGGRCPSWEGRGEVLTGW